jgi:uncharacterized protein YeaO (DUF488 family)
MIRIIKKSSQIHSKEESVRIIEDKLCPSKDNKEQLKLDMWMDDFEGTFIGDPFFDDNEKWTEFQDRYLGEFENKIELMDDILTKKKERIKVTWISIFKRK